MKLSPPFRFVRLLAPLVSDIAVTFGSVSGPSKARAFLILEVEDSLFVWFYANRFINAAIPAGRYVVYCECPSVSGIEQTSSMRDHLEQAASRMIVLLCVLKCSVSRDALAQQRDLDLG